MIGEFKQGHLFDEAISKDELLTIRTDGVRLENGRSFGSVWLGWVLWNSLGLRQLVGEVLPAGRETVSWSTMAAVLTIARFCEPSSELHIGEDWYRRTAFSDLIGVVPEMIGEDRLYRALDRLLPHKEAIEKHLVKRLGELFSLEYDLLLYDVTSTYFEGLHADPRIARRGYSRDHRPDCVQVNIALVVTREGIPLGYEIFPGNTTDVRTVEEIVEMMESRYGKADRVWVMDRGMVSEENVAWLRDGRRRYILGTSRSELRRWARELVDRRDWQQIREGVEVKICTAPHGDEVFILCRSEDRASKEKAMHERFSLRIEEALGSLRRRIEKSTKRIEKGAIERQLGRLLQRNSRAAGRFTVNVLDDPTCAAGIKVVWSINSQWDEWSRHSEGTYILRTNIANWTPDTLWATYIQLTDAEAAFRIQKSDLSIRPIWHRKGDRIKAHILVCFLAYVMWKTLEQWQARAGLGNSPRTVLHELAPIQSADIVLPLANEPGRELRLRCVVRPDRAQAAILDRLGLKLPQRIRQPLQTIKM